MTTAGSFLLVAALGSFGGVGAAGSSKAQAGPTAAPTAGATTGAKGTSAPSAPTPGAPKPTTGATAAPAAAAINLPIEGQRKRDLEDLQRQSVAAALAQMKVNVDWREHKLAELTDWRDRIEVVIVTPNDTLTIPRGEIQSLTQAQLSMMPEGLLEPLNPQEVRDLIYYLRQSGQVPLPKAAQ